MSNHLGILAIKVLRIFLKNSMEFVVILYYFNLSTYVRQHTHKHGKHANTQAHQARGLADSLFPV